MDNIIRGTRVIEDKRVLTGFERRKQREQNKKWKRERTEKRLIKRIETEFNNQQKEENQLLKQAKERSEQKLRGRNYTVSLALPGSILDNAQSQELQSYLVGQIARSLVIFNVDEVVVFDETCSTTETLEGAVVVGSGKKSSPTIQMARILQYLECPQYLRKQLFPVHSDLQYAGLLNPLDAPHHLRSQHILPYREGVVVNLKTKPGKGSYVNIGLKNEVQIDKQIQAGVRVTVKLDNPTADTGDSVCSSNTGRVVAPTTPRTEAGLYWGYEVRLANSVSAVFNQCNYQGGYDLIIGTSDKGSPVEEIHLKRFRHMLVVFGGVKGLEASVEADEHTQCTDPSQLVDHYVNVCPGQGSRTIRTEEAVLITMATLRPMIKNVQCNRWGTPIEFINQLTSIDQSSSSSTPAV